LYFDVINTKHNLKRICAFSRYAHSNDCFVQVVQDFTIFTLPAGTSALMTGTRLLSPHFHCGKLIALLEVSTEKVAAGQFILMLVESEVYGRLTTF
jgi:hypothetical protein